MIGGKFTGRAFASTVKSIATIKLMLKSPANASHVRSGIDVTIVEYIYTENEQDKFVDDQKAKGLQLTFDSNRATSI